MRSHTGPGSRMAPSATTLAFEDGHLEAVQLERWRNLRFGRVRCRKLEVIRDCRSMCLKRISGMASAVTVVIQRSGTMQFVVFQRRVRQHLRWWWSPDLNKWPRCSNCHIRDWAGQSRDRENKDFLQITISIPTAQVALSSNTYTGLLPGGRAVDDGGRSCAAVLTRISRR